MPKARNNPVLQFVLVSLILSCGESPTEEASLGVISQLQPALVSSTTSIEGDSWTVTLTPVNSNQTIGPIVTGNFERTTLVRFTASGSICPIINWGEPPPNGYKGVCLNSLDAGGVWAHNGCTANVSIKGSISGGNWFCFYPGYARDFDMGVLIRGEAGVIWNRGPAWYVAGQCGGDSEPCYVYDGSGGFIAMVQKLPAEVTFTPGDVIVAPGDTIDYSISISPTEYDGVPMPFKITDYWRFQPDSGALQTVCLPYASCKFVATKSGRMLVSLHAQGDSIRYEGKVTVESPVELELSMTCTPSPVVRTDNVSCNATWTPNTVTPGEILFEWTFKSDSVRVFPAANAQAFDPPPQVDSAGQGMSSWSGPAVLGGQVSVRATRQGQVKTDSATIAVSARTAPAFGNLPVTFASAMADMPTMFTDTLENQPHPDPGGAPGAVGNNYDTQSGGGDPDMIIHGQPSVTQASSGPNRGFWFVLSPGVQSTRGARIRTWLSGRENPPMFRYTPTGSTALTNRALLNVRKKSLNSPTPMHSDSVALLNGVWAHETYGTATAKGHQGQIELAAKSLPTCGKVPAILERAVAGDSTTLRVQVIGSVMFEGKQSLLAASDHDRVYGNRTKDTPFYQVVSQLTVADNLKWKVVKPDAKATPDPNLAPVPQWGCTRVY